MSRTTVERGPRRGAGLRARLLAALLALAVLPSLAGAQSVEDKYRMHRDRMSRFNLAAGPTTVLAVNQWQCGLNSEGDTCTDVFDSPTGGGGFWPTGSPNQYMFNSGIQVAGIIPESENFDWAGDTVGAMFMDASGNYAHGTAITDIYNSLDANDIENWPTLGSIPEFPFLNGIVDDPEIFNEVLIGRKAASQQDSWVAYWDGDPNKTGGRTHPMGIVVEQRTMAWNYPEGNESVIYLIYRFTNATNNPTFQRLNETKYGISLPDEGWRFDSVYVAYDSDPDVGATATNNYATGILPFNLGLAYEGNFYDNAFIYPSTLFHPPFFTTAPGIVAMKYLKSPVDPLTGEEVGMTSLSQHTNGGSFPDPNTVQRLWRYISLNTDAGKGDPSCNVTVPLACFLANTQSDVRLFIGSGPFSLDAGQSSTIAVAMYAAATVATPLITSAPSADNKPLIPSLNPGCPGEPIRPIEVASGYIGPRPGACPGEGGPPRLSQHDIDVVPNSLLGRGLVAQAIFDNKFLLGFAPEAPPFYLVPGDNQVTVVWEPSATVEAGDPFFSAAGDTLNALYDPNYREFDVEGYRIYRGTSPADLRLIAQFDETGTVFTDVLCVTDPEHVTSEPCTEIHEVDIVSPFVQNLQVEQLTTGAFLPLRADTALAGEMRAGTSLPLTNSGIPYAYIDRDVRNGFLYHYKVTAFDINSAPSGPSSLESAAPTKSVKPVPAASSLVGADLEFGLFGRSALPPSTGLVAIDPVTGTFAGPQPPTNAIELVFQAFAPQLLPPGTHGMTLDSITPDYYGGIYHFSMTSGGGFSLTLTHAPDGDDVFNLPLLGIAADPTLRAQLIAQGVDAPPLAGSFTGVFSVDRMQFHSGDNDWAYSQPGFWSRVPPNTLNGGSRWFSGANETVPDPTVGHKPHGTLDGMESPVFSPDPYRAADGVVGLAGFDPNLLRRFYQSTWAIRRAADVKFYWGAAGLDSVIDVTHDLPVAFGTSVNATYGFIPDSDVNGLISWNDMRRAPSALASYAAIPNFGVTPSVPLVPQPVVLPTDVTGDHVAEGSGFGIYINGEMFFFHGPVPVNTVWTLRTYSGSLTGGPGAYAFTPTTRTPGVPGLGLEVTIHEPAQIVAAQADLKLVHVVPDPYYAVSTFDRGPQAKELTFVNLPSEATIRIYSLSGVLVDIVNHTSLEGGGLATWDLRNRSNQFVASGVYFFHVSTPDGKEHVGKFTVVNAGFGR